MYAGRLMELADTREILDNPKHPYTIGLLDSIPKKKGTPLQPISGVVPRPEDLPAGCKFMDRCRYAIRECGVREPELREIAARHRAPCIRVNEITGTTEGRIPDKILPDE